jgi:hypothetical protein
MIDAAAAADRVDQYHGKRRGFELSPVGSGLQRGERRVFSFPALSIFHVTSAVDQVFNERAKGAPANGQS